MPTVVNDLVASAVKAGGTVQFAYRIGTKPNDSVVGYEYTVQQLIEAEPVSVIEEIRARMSGKAIAAPTKGKK